MLTAYRIASRVLLIGAALLLSPAVFADDAETPDAAPLPSPDNGLSAIALPAELRHPFLWRLGDPVDVIALSELQPHPLQKISFENSDLLSRFSKLRGLSMLTMAEIGSARLFFGVNNDGLVGLHFNTSAQDLDSLHIEVLRMPYLATKPADEEALSD